VDYGLTVIGAGAIAVTGSPGARNASQLKMSSVYLATLPDDGPSGILWGHLWTADGDGGYGTLAW
jgi:hypothetical protein